MFVSNFVQTSTMEFRDDQLQHRYIKGKASSPSESYNVPFGKRIYVQKGKCQLGFVNFERWNDSTNDFTKDARVTQGHFFISRDKGSGCTDKRPSWLIGKCSLSNNKIHLIRLLREENSASQLNKFRLF